MAEVGVEVSDGVMVVTIDRPQARNAINRAAALGIAAAMAELESRSDVVLGVLTGAGGTFSAGMDLKAFLAGEDPEIEGRGFAGLCARPPAKPLIAAVEGWALAGGCEIALACDLIVAAEDARFGLPEVKRGLVAAAGGLFRLPRRLPPGVAMELALTGDPLPAADAHRLGLVNRLTPAGGALAGALELAGRVAANGPLALAATKRVITESAGWSEAEAWAAQDGIVRPVLRSEDAREGARAFAEKRPPVWSGR